jgi:hypothetical protein
MASKLEILSEIEKSHPNLAHEVATKYGGMLLDLSCRTPKCGNRISRHWVPKPIGKGTIQDEIKYVLCSKCGVKGYFAYDFSRAPSDKDVALARAMEVVKQKDKIKSDIESVEAKVESLLSQRLILQGKLDALSPKKA